MYNSQIYIKEKTDTKYTYIAIEFSLKTNLQVLDTYSNWKKIFKYPQGSLSY